MENKKFEQLIELIINENEEQAKELFHDIVVEKSREIYENIMAEEAMEESMHDDMGEGHPAGRQLHRLVFGDVVADHLGWFPEGHRQGCAARLSRRGEAGDGQAIGLDLPACSREGG